MQCWLARQGLNGNLEAKVNNLTHSYGCEGIVNDHRVLDLSEIQLEETPTWENMRFTVKSSGKAAKNCFKGFLNVILPRSDSLPRTTVPHWPKHWPAVHHFICLKLRFLGFQKWLSYIYVLADNWKLQRRYAKHGLRPFSAVSPSHFLPP